MDERKLSDRFRCDWCIDQGWPEMFGSEPRCAFATDGTVFTADNWNCATINQLRDLIDESCGGGDGVYNDEQRLGIVRGPSGSYVVLGQYKHRGSLEVAIFVDETAFRVLDLPTADRVLRFHAAGTPRRWEMA